MTEYDDAKEKSKEALETCRHFSPEYKIKFVKCFEQIIKLKMTLAKVQCQLYEEEIIMMSCDLQAIDTDPIDYFDNNGPFNIKRSDSYYKLNETRDQLLNCIADLENNFVRTGISPTLN